MNTKFELNIDFEPEKLPPYPAQLCFSRVVDGVARNTLEPAIRKMPQLAWHEKIVRPTPYARSRSLPAIPIDCGKAVPTKASVSVADWRSMRAELSNYKAA